MNDPCEKMQDTITDYILGTLNRRDLDALQKHLSWCSQCRKYTQALEEQGRSLGRLAKQLDADMTAREDSAIEALNCSALTEHGSSGSFWDIIIRNKVIKTAAAAMIIAALPIIIITGIIVFAPSPAYAEITWADVQVAFVAQKWVHVKYDNGREYWHDLVNDKTFDKTERGSMYVDDPGKGIRYSYSPRQEDLIRIRTFGNREDETIQSEIRTAWEVIVERFDKASEKSRDLIEKHTVTIDGRELVRFDLYYKNILNERVVIRQLWADPETRLPVRIWEKVPLSWREWQGRDHITGVFEFPQAGPETIYDLGIPPEVKIVDTRQRGESSSDEAKDLLQISKENSEDFPIRYRAVIWERRDQNN
ncbi:MAG: zf-HC2 domain-containing protein, partial [Planctomycetota bacterium]